MLASLSAPSLLPPLCCGRWRAGTTETQWHRAGTNVNLRWKTMADCFLLLKRCSWVEAENGGGVQYKKKRKERKATEGETATVLLPFRKGNLWQAPIQLPEDCSEKKKKHRIQKIKGELVCTWWWIPCGLSLFKLPEGTGSRQVHRVTKQNIPRVLLKL